MFMQLYSNKNDLNAHHIEMTISKLVNGNFPGGLEDRYYERVPMLNIPNQSCLNEKLLSSPDFFVKVIVEK